MLSPPATPRTPAVSIILPTFNRAHCLARAVESVLRQTYADFELIIVDDCSADDTDAYLATITDPRVRIERHPVNKGGAAARNTGIAVARAPIIAFQDSDDEWCVTMLDRQMRRRAEVGPEYRASYCGKIVHGRDNQGNFGSRLAAYMPPPDRKVAEGNIYEEVLQHAIVSTQTLIVDKSVLDEVGGFDESLRVGLDWELTCRIAAATPFAFVEEPLVMTYLMPDSITHRRLSGAVTLARIMERHAAAYGQNPSLKAAKLFQIGRIYQRAGHYRAALGPLRQSMAIRPFKPATWAALAKSLMTAPLRADPTG